MGLRISNTILTSPVNATGLNNTGILYKQNYDSVGYGFLSTKYNISTGVYDTVAYIRHDGGIKGTSFINECPCL
jgi:hypothetical protein